MEALQQKFREVYGLNSPPLTPDPALKQLKQEEEQARKEFDNVDLTVSLPPAMLAPSADKPEQNSATPGSENADEIVARPGDQREVTVDELQQPVQQQEKPKSKTLADEIQDKRLSILEVMDHHSQGQTFSWIYSRK